MSWQQIVLYTTPLIYTWIEIDTCQQSSTFKDFTRLPRELQDMIWKFALDNQEARIIDMDPSETIPAEIPALLHGCHDSRQIALKSYNLIRHQRQKYYFYNPAFDTLVFEDQERIWSYIQLWKNPYSTRASSIFDSNVKVLDLRLILKKVQFISIKDRSSTGMYELIKFNAFRNLKLLELNCPWIGCEEDGTAERWAAHWLETWWDLRRDWNNIPVLKFNFATCYREDCCLDGGVGTKEGFDWPTEIERLENSMR